MKEPKTRQEIIDERIAIDKEFEKYVDETGDMEGGDAWRSAAYDEIEENK